MAETILALIMLNVSGGTFGVAVAGAAAETIGAVSGVAFSGGVFSHLNRDAYVPAFYLEPSGAVTIAEVTSLFMPEILLAESTLSLKGDEQAVARAIPSCFPESACRSVAIVLTAPADGGDPELPATK